MPNKVKGVEIDPVKEKLIECYLKSIDKCLNTKCRNCEYFSEPQKPKRRCQAAMVADDLIANGVTIATDNNVGHKWIPVTERLPEEGETVLVFGYWHEKFQPLMCYLSPHRKGEWFTTVAGPQVYTVTHWMPLPEPPKGE